MSVCSTINQERMLAVHCNTVLGKGKGKGQRTHIHWHVNIQADGIWSQGSASLTNKLGTSLEHKTKIPILGSKQRLNLQGQHESLAGEGGPPAPSCLGAQSCGLLMRRWPREASVEETTSRGQGGGAPGAKAALWPLASCPDQPWPRTVHRNRCGTPPTGGTQPPLGGGHGNPQTDAASSSPTRPSPPF